VSKVAKTLDRVLRGTADANIGFDDLRALLRHLGFDERVRSSHHIFSREDVEEIINLQPKGGKAKAYQVKQVRGVIVSYGLAGTEDSPADESAEGESGSATTEEEDGS
jgi:hypothetical protein